MKTKWKPTKENLVLAFAELANGVGRSGFPHNERDLVVKMCFARRDLQLAILGHGKQPDKRKRRDSFNEYDAGTDLREMSDDNALRKE